MDVTKKSANTGESLMGRIKKVFGRMTGNRSMEAEGRGEQAKGGMKQAGENVKDAFRH